MKILMIHNEYAAPSGEEIQFYHIVKVLKAHGHEIKLYTRNSAEIESKAFGRLKAFFSGISNPFSRRDVRELVKTYSPDIVFIQNLFPLISPAILPLFRTNDIPVVMRVANYRLMCPNGLHLSHGEVCERCLYNKEYWCILKNCEENMFESTGYALRNAIARMLGFYKNSVNAYICASHFLRNKMISAGFEASKLHVIPNIVPDVGSKQAELNDKDGAYVAFVGRISKEKGVHVLLDAARMCPDIPFRLAGRINPSFRLPDPIPPNVQLVGFLQNDDLSGFYRRSRLFVSTSVCFETFGISVAEAMLYSKPVIVSRIGVFPEFVRDGVTGLLSEPGNAEDLASKITYLWENPELANKMGSAGREHALKAYSRETYYEKLITILGGVRKTYTGNAD
jgi:glycosyltransferase involved in cell wall biosynthesis